LLVTAIGYTKAKQYYYSIPSDTLFVMLEVRHEELEEIVVQSTRTSRTIANTPTRVETIGIEEIDEKNNMRPGNVAMLLHESTGYRYSKLLLHLLMQVSGYRDWTDVILSCLKMGLLILVISPAD
jgi:hypothetical protein